MKDLKIVAGVLLVVFLFVIFCQPAKAEEWIPTSPYYDIIMNASEQDIVELEGALYIEARGESWEGQLATAQVILNRVLSPYYPNTIHGVLSQVDCGYKQYASYPKCKTCPRGEQQSDVIEELVDGRPEEFPLTTDYIYQARFQQGKNRIKIGKQWFGTRGK